MPTAMERYQTWMQSHVRRIGVNALARRLGVNPSTILAYETARVIPERFREPAIAEATGNPLAEVGTLLEAAREERSLRRAQRMGYDSEALRRLLKPPRKRPNSRGPHALRGGSGAKLPRPPASGPGLTPPPLPPRGRRPKGPQPHGDAGLRSPSYRTPKAA